ncbi:hypothetical protein MUY27_10680 [Mucilaginibacter sp. RS28]|uniref:Uncharacterized protein n=1 Tax=Mucilaginibacter straminoryzae TaxID=2932774 RepID=A0A9X1X3E7_9SPHI|nr:hypothetical protein [Mucilaginibacter straminoryzae]MCJ8210176.1 hypothetical protein [Mucilaginibacter straminoryzae]
MNSEKENREWLQEYPSLKQVNSNNPFTVPESYFNGLEEQIISGVRLQESVPASAQAFTVPEHYFNELESNILSRIKVEEAVAQSQAAFSVPENYFEELSDNINARIGIEELVNDANAFSIPENYFEDLSANIEARVNIEQVAGKESPFIVPETYFEDMKYQLKSRLSLEDAFGAALPLEVPANYFDSLHLKILNKVTDNDSEKRRSVVRRMFSSAAFKYASAACFALIIGAAVFIGGLNSSHDRTYLHKALSDVPDNTIESYLDLHLDNSDTRILLEKADLGNEGLDHISTDDLKDYLSNN